MSSDKSLDGYFHGVYRIESLVYEYHSRRDYLAAAVPALWEKLLKANFGMASLELGVQVTREAAVGLRDDELLYGEIKSEIETLCMNFLESLNKNLSPLLAEDLARKGMARVQSRRR